jgi:Domain of unknown function DUF1828
MLITDCSQIKGHVRDLPLVRSCDQLHGGSLRMSTPFSYPNGDYIDVFLESGSDIFGSFLLLTDYGQTGIFLHNYQVEMDSTKYRVKLVDDITAELGVTVRDGILQVKFKEGEDADFSDAILRLSQACVRVSDLAYHPKVRSALPFKKEIHSFLMKSNFRVNSDAKLPGLFGREVKIDFEVQTETSVSLLLTMASRNDSSLHVQVNEVFGRWASLEPVQPRRLTLVDSTSKEMLRDDDRRRIETFSPVYFYPSEERKILSALKGQAA